MNHEILTNELNEATKELISKVELMEKEVNRLSLFNEYEKYSDSKIKEPTLEEITYKKSKKGSYISKKADLRTVIINII